MCVLKACQPVLVHESELRLEEFSRPLRHKSISLSSQPRHHIYSRASLYSTLSSSPNLNRIPADPPPSLYSTFFALSIVSSCSSSFSSVSQSPHPSIPPSPARLSVRVSTKMRQQVTGTLTPARDMPKNVSSDNGDWELAALSASSGSTMKLPDDSMKTVVMLLLRNALKVHLVLSSVVYVLLARFV